MKTVLVAGCNGFAGQHMVENLHRNEVKVIGCGREVFPVPNISGFLSEYVRCDLTDKAGVEEIPLDTVHAVINLAGIAVNNPKETDAEGVVSVNVNCHTVLYDRLSRIKSSARIICVSSGAIYDPSSPMPLTEDSPLVDIDAASPYITSKLALERRVDEYEGLDIVIARPFNHTGPGQGAGFLVPDWADKLSDSNNRLDVSTLKAYRDFTDVRDVVEAYARLALADPSKLNHRIYNISSGVAQSTYHIVSLLAAHMHMELPELEEGPDDNKIFADHQRITDDTGWQPRIAINETLGDFVTWCLNR